MIRFATVTFTEHTAELNIYGQNTPTDLSLKHSRNFVVGNKSRLEVLNPINHHLLDEMSYRPISGNLNWYSDDDANTVTVSCVRFESEEIVAPHANEGARDYLARVGGLTRQRAAEITSDICGAHDAGRSFRQIARGLVWHLHPNLDHTALEESSVSQERATTIAFHTYDLTTE